MIRAARGVLLALAAGLIAAPAWADMISFTYDFRIGEATDNIGLFGDKAGSELAGDPIQITFLFDTTQGVRGAVPGTTDALVGGLDAPTPTPASSPLVSATITINRHTAVIGGELLGAALTDAGVFNGSEAIQDDGDYVDAFVYTKDAPASLNTPFTPHGDGSGNFGLEVLNTATGDEETVIGNFGIPEPAAWSIMLTGFAGIGAAVRRSRRKTRAGATIA